MLPESRPAYADVDDDIDDRALQQSAADYSPEKAPRTLHFNGAPSQQIVLGNADQSL